MQVSIQLYEKLLNLKVGSSTGYYIRTSNESISSTVGIDQFFFEESRDWELPNYAI